MCSATSDVHFTPDSDRESDFPQKAMSALPPKADMCSALAHVCFGPKADVASLFDYFVCAPDERVWDVDTEGLCRFQINNQLDFSCLLDR
jgi:hypothetical protein